MTDLNAPEQPGRVAVIGGGPAGLMAAEVLAQGGAQVDVFDAMPSVGRKFLLAGVGGMNITHSEPFEHFVPRYGDRQNEVRVWLESFNADALQSWVHDLGIETFVGTSGRIFPTDMKAAPLLRAWLHRLRVSGVRFYQRHSFCGWNEAGELCFHTPDGERTAKADAVVLALGGGSWARLGSDGSWLPWLESLGVDVSALQPSNCGFDIEWSDFLRQNFAGAPLKSVIASCTDIQGHLLRREGECILSSSGIEGSVIYALSASLRELINRDGEATLHLDMAPHRSKANLLQALARPRGKDSRANHWRKTVSIDGAKAALLREQLTAEQLDDNEQLAAGIKQISLRLVRTRPIDEAISTAGGVAFSAVDPRLMLKALPGVFCAGEMLDWEAPTGGYLLTACMASGRVAGQGVLQWLHSRAEASQEKITPE
ncbi:MAG: TIGR03862 family flavoprotein [Moraxellaceae bacterium]